MWNITIEVILLVESIIRLIMSQINVFNKDE